jgi:ribosomal protein L29
MARAKKVEEVVEISAEEKLKQLKAEMAELKAQQKAEQLQKKLERAQRRKELLQNGEMPPERPGACMTIWEFCFAYREEHGVTPSSGFVKEALPELNVHTVQTQTARFRKYVGDVGATAVVNDPFRKKAEEA